jgi:GT2 family glycosyltransferase
MVSGKTCVVTVNYNSSGRTVLCVDSLRASRERVQVVVVDNTPYDRLLVEKLEVDESTVLITAPYNLGFGKGNNLGINWAIENTDCEYIFILNNDATVSEDTIGNLQKVLAVNSHVGVAVPRIVLEENHSTLWYGGGEIDWKRGGPIAPGFLGPADSELALQSRSVGFGSGCAMLIRTEILKGLGGFDSRYFMYEEDTELSLRIRQHGWTIWYESSSIVKHLVHGSTKADDKADFVGALDPRNPNLEFFVYHMVRNRLLTMKIYAKGKNRREFLRWFPVFMSLKIFRFLQHRRWGAIGAIYKGWNSYRILKNKGIV